MEIALQLAAYRKTVGDEVKKSVASILDAYRRSFAAAAASDLAEAVARDDARALECSAQERDRARYPDRDDRRTGVARRPVGGESGHRDAERARDDRDRRDAGAAVGVSAGSRERGARDVHAVAGSRTRLGRQEQPKLFSGLVAQLQPYLGLSADERVAVGEPAALLGYLRDSFAVRFDDTALQGATAGFESRMTVEPVGNLHLERIEMYPSGVERGELVLFSGPCTGRDRQPQPQGMVCHRKGVRGHRRGTTSRATASRGWPRRTILRCPTTDSRSTRRRSTSARCSRQAIPL